MNKVVFPVRCTWNEEEGAIYQFIVTVMQRCIPVRHMHVSWQSSYRSYGVHCQDFYNCFVHCIACHACMAQVEIFETWVSIRRGYRSHLIVG